MNERTSQLAQEAFALFGVDSFFALHRAYTEEDQRLMKAGLWDPDNPELLTNKTKRILEQIDSSDLDDGSRDREWLLETLWFWYHHATSCVLGKVNGKIRAQNYASQALALQSNDNRITRLLYLLVNEDLDAAKLWMAELPQGADEEEHRTGLSLIEAYESGHFFDEGM